MIGIGSPVSPKSHAITDAPPASKCYCIGERIDEGEAGIWKEITVFTNGKSGVIKLFSQNADEELSIYHITLDPSFGDFGHLKNLATNNHSAQDVFHWEIIEQTQKQSVLRYKYMRSGRYILNVKFDGLDIAGSPFLIVVTPGIADPKACKLINADKSLITPKNSSTIYNKITLQIRDSNNMIIPHGFHNVSVKVHNGVYIKHITDNMDGTYLIVYSITSNDNPMLRVLLDGNDVYGSPVTFNIINLEQYNNSIKTLTFDEISHSVEKMIGEGKLDECEQIITSNNLNEVLDKIIVKLRQQIYNIGSKKYDLMTLKTSIIDKMHQNLSNDYQDMYNSKTELLMSLVKSLDSIEINDITSLSNFILTYKNISDELSKLHRHDVAMRINELIKFICGEINLNRISSDLNAKESIIKTQEVVIKNKFDLMKSKLDEIKSRPFPVDDTLLHYDKETITNINAPKLTRLLQRRIAVSGKQSDQTCDSASRKIDGIVSKFWVKSGVYDIHTTVFNVLKSSPRLNRATFELFKFYAPVNWINMINLVIDLKIDINLQLNVPRLKWLFNRFSNELVNNVNGKNQEVKREGFVRVIPEFLWIAFLRELAYINLLYVLASNNPKILESDHPSRLVSFHHFCNYHFVPLYQNLFYTQEFQNRALIVDGEVQVKEVDARLMVSDLYKYLNKRLPGDVSQRIDLDALQLIFNHYITNIAGKHSEDSSSYGKLSEKNRKMNEMSMSSSAMIRFVCDFGVVPDHMSGNYVRELIADSKLTFDNFVKTVVSILSLLVKHYIVNQQQALGDTTGPHYTSLTIEDVKKQADYFINLLHLSDVESVKFVLYKIK
ncbi:hypothetical protein BMR1_03g03575 [Babesia microti strain RI]|uniref:Uncharacterized protein n=1 Tax=Babesia microti (strain RI) TaxID=1133968 RepID=A0A0K3AS62_BABMR|nr:hypothetical protein BMR1_03g03575 [Babesia microti strain RI]CTQ41315.1 hypothetical protein BMR1_03g03575 [Babesia microti strain RI]|eukprot:XP_012649326.1 hypothetical protein BMR1_03g03575 [Babesia microti strain RI]